MSGMTDYEDGMLTGSMPAAGNPASRTVRAAALEVAIATAVESAFAAAGCEVGAMTGAVPCDDAARPAGAPVLTSLVGSVQRVRRLGGGLVVDYAPAAARALDEAVVSERSCCPQIGWRLDPAGELITAPA